MFLIYIEYSVENCLIMIFIIHRIWENLKWLWIENYFLIFSKEKLMKKKENSENIGEEEWYPIYSMFFWVIELFLINVFIKDKVKHGQRIDKEILQRKK
jgi:hypothetical protein